MTENLPAIPLDGETLAVHNWFSEFVAYKGGQLPANLSLKEQIRCQIAVIEALFKQSCDKGEHEDTSQEYPLRNIFAPGVYIRELTIPAGHFVVGRIHKHEHANFISRGKVSVLTEDGGLEVLTGPCTMISPAGCKRLLFTHEETVWSVVHPTELTDLDEIEAAVIAQNYTELGLYDPTVDLKLLGDS